MGSNSSVKDNEIELGKQARINSLKLLGFSLFRHETGMYVAYSNNADRCNVYNSKLEPIIVGKEIGRIGSNFIEVKTLKGKDIYSLEGELLVSDSEGYNIKVNEDIVYVSKERKLNYVITPEGKRIYDVPKIWLPSCVLGKDGNVYTIAPNGDLYRGTEKIESRVATGSNYFSKHYYTRTETGKAKVCDLYTQQPITNKLYHDVEICDDKVLLKVKNNKFQYYHDGVLKTVEVDDLTGIRFVYNATYTKVLFMLRYENDFGQIADLNMKILNDNQYTYIDSVIHGKYVKVNTESGRVGILDLEQNKLIEAYSVDIGGCGIQYNDKGESHTLLY